MILLLTPLQIEHDALITALEGPLTKSGHGGVTLNSAKTQGVSVAVGGHGKVQFALTTQHLIRELSPRLVICAGACGALSPTLKALDVVVATETVEHDFRLRFVRKPEPRFAGDTKSLSRLRKLAEGAASTAPTGEFSTAIHFGTIASGDEDVIAETRAVEIQAQTGAIAVAWEGAGGARACRFQNVPYLEIRTVTDSSNASAKADFTRNVKEGMTRIMEILVQSVLS